MLWFVGYLSQISWDLNNPDNSDETPIVNEFFSSASYTDSIEYEALDLFDSSANETSIALKSCDEVPDDMMSPLSCTNGSDTLQED